MQKWFSIFIILALAGPGSLVRAAECEENTPVAGKSGSNNRVLCPEATVQEQSNLHVDVDVAVDVKVAKENRVLKQIRPKKQKEPCIDKAALDRALKQKEEENWYDNPSTNRWLGFAVGIVTTVATIYTIRSLSK